MFHGCHRTWPLTLQARQEAGGSREGDGESGRLPGQSGVLRGDPVPRECRGGEGAEGDWVFRRSRGVEGGRWVPKRPSAQVRSVTGKQPARATGGFILTGLSACFTETKTGSKRRAQSHTQLVQRRRGCARTVPESKVEASRA